MTEMQNQKTVTLDDMESSHIKNHLAPYFGWIRHVVTLSTGVLTALVALQGHYIPRAPRLSLALALCWVALAATITLGLFALRAEYLSSLAVFGRLRTLRATIGDTETIRMLSKSPGYFPPWHHYWAVRGMMLCFLVALSSLCTFAVVNVGP